MFHFSLVKKFSLVLLLALVAFSLSIGEIMSSAMRNIMITSANEITSRFLQHEVQNHLQGKRIPGGDAGEWRSALAREVKGLDLGPDVAVSDIQVWDQGRPAGWASAVIEERQNGPAAILAAMFSGRAFVEGAGSRSWAEKFGNVVPARQTLTFVVPVRLNPSGKGELGLKVEANFAKLVADIDWYNQAVWLTVLSGCLLLYLLLYGLYWGAARQIAAAERENSTVRGTLPQPDPSRRGGHRRGRQEWRGPPHEPGSGKDLWLQSRQGRAAPVCEPFSPGEPSLRSGTS